MWQVIVRLPVVFFYYLNKISSFKHFQEYSMKYVKKFDIIYQNGRKLYGGPL